MLTRLSVLTPALLIRMSIRPIELAIWRMPSFTAASSVTSSLRAMAFGSEAAVCFATVSLTSATTTRAPIFSQCLGDGLTNALRCAGDERDGIV